MSTTDDRLDQQLEAQLGQADRQRAADNEKINQQNAEIQKLQARVSDLQPLADAASRHRDDASSLKSQLKDVTAQLEDAKRQVSIYARNLQDAEAEQERQQAMLQSLRERIDEGKRVLGG
jgi:chromosome segregation ATPase